jgi:hypothetical protein
MLFPGRYWEGLAGGSITVAFRRQKRPTVKAGGNLRSPGGYLAIDAVDAITEDEITDADARAAGHANRDEVIASLKPEGTLYRFRFHLAGVDPRDTLRAAADGEDFAELAAKVAKLDWAIPVLKVIRDNPEVVSTELAPQVGMERAPFKQKVTRLKALGLTISFSPGYRLSPRGEAFLRSVLDD